VPNIRLCHSSSVSKQQMRESDKSQMCRPLAIYYRQEK